MDLHEYLIELMPIEIESPAVDLPKLTVEEQAIYRRQAAIANLMEDNFGVLVQ